MEYVEYIDVGREIGEEREEDDEDDDGDERAARELEFGFGLGFDGMLSGYACERRNCSMLCTSFVLRARGLRVPCSCGTGSA